MSSEPLHTDPGPPLETLRLTEAPLGHNGLPSTLLAIEERIASLLAIELSNLLRSRVQITSTQNPPRRWREIVETQEASVINLLEFEQLGGNGLFLMEWRTFFELLDRIFGGHSKSVQPDRSSLSKVEERVMKRLTHIFARSVESSWRSVVPFTVKHLRIDHHIANTGIAQETDWVLQHSYHITGEEADLGSFHLFVPVALLDSVKGKLRAPQEGKRRREGVWEDPIRGLLQQVTVELCAELGRAQMTLKDILELNVGDTIRLDQAAERPVIVSVEGVPKYRGEISVQFGNIAIQLRSTSGRQSITQELKDE